MSNSIRVSAVALFFTALLQGAPAAVSPMNLDLPIAFERQNSGPGFGAGERFIAHGQGYRIAVDGDKTTINLQGEAGKAGSTISMEFAGEFASVSHAPPVAGPELPGKVNYIRGNDPAKWKLGLPTYERISYRDVYPGIDVVYYGNNRQLEFDMVLKPGADPQAIAMKFAGAKRISVDAGGKLVLETSAGDIRLGLPQIYQQEAGGKGVKKTVEGHFVVHGENKVGFEIASYDRTRPLVIDPTILFGAFLGGATENYTGNWIALDGSGNIYLTGSTYEPDFPTTSGAAQGYAGNSDGFVTKINSTGTAIIFSTYLGGSSYDSLSGIAADSTGAAWVTGFTYSSDFPLVNPYQATGGSDVVIAKLTPTGALQFSTYLGNYYSSGTAVAVDSANNAYVVGNADNSFPTTPGVLLPTGLYQGFVAKFTSTGSIVYSTLLGGPSGTTTPYAVVADASGNAYVTGPTTASTFVGAPPGGAQPTNTGYNIFITKINPTGTALVYFTFLAGVDYGQSIAIDSSLNAYIGGWTSLTNLNPTPGAVQSSLLGEVNGFVAKLNPTGSAFSYITYLGGGRIDEIYSVAVEPSSGDLYVAGYTDSSNFPMVSPIEAYPTNPVSLFQTNNDGASWSAFDSNLRSNATAISPDPVQSGTFIVSTEGDNSIYRTVNNGQTWIQLYNGSGDAFSRCAANPMTIYEMAGGDAIVSTDNGNTWYLKGLVGVFTNAIVADPLTATTAYTYSNEYTSSSSFLYKTTNGGATWTALPGLPSTSQIYGVVAASNGTLYAAIAQYGVYQSVDQGVTWTAMNSGLPSPFYTSTGQVLSVTSGSPNILYLAYGNTIFKSSGGAWAPAPGSVPNGAISVVSSPTNASLAYAISFQPPYVYVTLDGGNTWNVASSGLGVASLTGIVFNPQSATGAFAIATTGRTAFLSKLNATGTALVYSTYLGGSDPAGFVSLASDGVGQTVVGISQSIPNTFPVPSSLPASSIEPGVFVFAISDATPACSYSVSPLTQTFYSYSQTATFDVNAPSGCSWTAFSNQSWATVVAGASGTGAGVVSVEIAANFGATRSASITVGGTVATFTQSASSCFYELSSYMVSLPASGGPGQVNLTAPIGCPWTIVNSDPTAITLTSPSSGSADATVTFTVAPSLDLNSRDLSLSIAGPYFYINQAGVCTYSLSSPGASLASAGGSGSVYLTTSSLGCSWTVVSNVSWLTITSSLTSGNGNSGIYYAVAANTGGPRQGTLTIGGQIFTINQSSTGLQFYPVTPCRLVDTRGSLVGFNGISPFNGPAIASGGTLTIPVQSAAEAATNTAPAPCGTIPSTALAYSLNITAVPQNGGAVDYISLWPSGSSQPIVATFNDPQGQIVANAAIVPAGTPSGGISIYNAGPSATDIVIDMNGYFAATTTQGSATGLQFLPVSPCRLIDTRGSGGGFNGISPFSGPSILSGGTATFPVQSSSEATADTAPAPCGTIPSGAQAYSINTTAVPHANGGVDFISLWPAGTAQPFVSTFNDPQGQIVANAALVPAGTPSGGISVYNAGPAATDVVIDMNGYFAASTGLKFYPMSPCRLVDTRGSGGGFNGIAPFTGPSIAAGGTLTVPVQSTTEAAANTTPAPCGTIPSTALAYSLNLTVVPHAPGAVDYVSMWPAGSPQPFVATLNDPEGLIVANAAIVPAGSGSGGISVYNAGPSATDVVIDMNGYFAP